MRNTSNRCNWIAKNYRIFLENALNNRNVYIVVQKKFKKKRLLLTIIETIIQESDSDVSGEIIPNQPKTNLNI